MSGRSDNGGDQVGGLGQAIGTMFRRFTTPSPPPPIQPDSPGSPVSPGTPASPWSPPTAPTAPTAYRLQTVQLVLKPKSSEELLDEVRYVAYRLVRGV